MDVVLIPAYEPDEELIRLVGELKEHAFTIVVVDDGSGKSYQHVFSAVRNSAHVVTLETNRGKGGALKAGMQYIREQLPECTHFITCDADGQHRPADVVRVREQLISGHKFVLTVRERKGKIPLRSRVGNDLSRIVYTLLTSRYLSDNQSGLRGFAREHLDWMVEVEKNNYDYEMNVLYYAAKMGLKITTLPIEAIYIENNASSHFNPIGDTVKIYKSLFSLAFATPISFLLTELLLLAATFTVNNRYIGFTIPTIGAFSMLTYILLNKFIFFTRISFREFLSTTMYTIIYYFVYTLMCYTLAFMFPQNTLFLNFNLVFLVCLPLRYFLHQLIFIASLTRE